jgi:hypothetical protein
MQITDTLLMVRPAAFGQMKKLLQQIFFNQPTRKTDPTSVQQAR